DTFQRNRLACLLVKRYSPNDQHCDNQQQHADNDEIEGPSGSVLSRSRLYGIEIFSSHQAFRGEFVEPGEQHRDWKPDRERNDNKSHRRIWNLKKWEDLCRELCQEPCNDPIRDCRAINVAPLQLGQKLRWIHSIAYSLLSFSRRRVERKKRFCLACGYLLLPATD